MLFSVLFSLGLFTQRRRRRRCLLDIARLATRRHCRQYGCLLYIYFIKQNDEKSWYCKSVDSHFFMFRRPTDLPDEELRHFKTPVIYNLTLNCDTSILNYILLSLSNKNPLEFVSIGLNWYWQRMFKNTNYSFVCLSLNSCFF